MDGKDSVCKEKIETIPPQSSVEKVYNHEMPGYINPMISLRKTGWV